MKINKYFLLISTILLTAFTFSDKAIFAKTNDIAIDKEYLYKGNSISEYIIGPGDFIFIRINNNEKFNLYKVDIDGTINIENLNRIYIEGLNINELTKILNSAFKEYIFEPDIRIKMAIYRPIRIFTSGELNNPGMHTLKGTYQPNFKLEDKSNNNQSELNTLDKGKLPGENYFPTLFDGLRVSGGITEYSDLTRIQVVRKNSLSNGGGKIYTTINLLNIIENGDYSQNLRLHDGDTIKVSRSKTPSSMQIIRAMETNLNPNEINVIVTGKVENPGSKKFKRNISLNEAILASGGTASIKGKITLIRYDSQSNINKKNISFSSYAKPGSNRNPFLKSGDIVYVNQSLIAASNEILGVILDPLIKGFTTYKIFED